MVCQIFKIWSFDYFNILKIAVFGKLTIFEYKKTYQFKYSLMGNFCKSSNHCFSKWQFIKIARFGVFKVLVVGNTDFNTRYI